MTQGPRTAQRSENPVENHSSKTQALDTGLSTSPIPNGKQKALSKIITLRQGTIQ